MTTSTVQYSDVQCSDDQYSDVQYSDDQYNCAWGTAHNLADASMLLEPAVLRALPPAYDYLFSIRLER